MNIEKIVENHLKVALKAVFNLEVAHLSLQATRKDFAGDFTFVTFNYSKELGKKPEDIGQALGEYLAANAAEIVAFNVVKGFLNIELSEQVWVSFLDYLYQNPDNFGQGEHKAQKVMIEFSSPNTNKPLHLGHLRTIFLGDSLSRIMQKAGYEVIKANLVNDRGIHICKSMVAYEKFGQQETPESVGIKGDHLVGKYYVEFEQALKQESQILEEAILQEQSEQSKTLYQVTFPLKVQKEIKRILNELAETKNSDKKEKEKKKKTADLKGELRKLLQGQTYMMREAKDLLKKWEENEPETIQLWKTLNQWVYKGFDETYAKIDVSFDKMYYESDTYQLGKDLIAEGLEKGVFYKKEDGSVWVDLTQEGLDHKLLLRGDQTAVYMTQDLGTADLKYQDYKIDKSVYVVGDEQEYHFKVLFLILKKLGRSYANGLYHLSYGMIDLTTGKMKSREGTVVDADNLVQEMMDTAKERTEELGKTEQLSDSELEQLYQMIGLGALKYFLLRVDPKKRMLFDPQKSVDFNGDAAPFIQFNHARISAILRSAKQQGISTDTAKAHQTFAESERALLQLISTYPNKIQESAEGYAPSIIANFAYDLAKAYSRFYTECPILKSDVAQEARAFRVALCQITAKILADACALLGFKVPERM